MTLDALAYRVIHRHSRTIYSALVVAVLDLNRILLNIQFRLIDLFLKTSEGNGFRKFSAL